MMRLDKLLSECGYGTRSEIKRRIRKEGCTVNGRAVNKPEEKVDPEKDEICFSGEAISYKAHIYLLMHKPGGVITATRDNRKETVMDLLPRQRQKGLFPVGRLDKDTEGLLLITNDGYLSHKLLSPKGHVPKTYYAEISGTLLPDAKEQFALGMDIGDEKPTLPGTLEVLETGLDEGKVRVTISEGRYHQVKRMIEKCGGHVEYLKRISFGPLVLPEDLPIGQYRALTKEEVAALSVYRKDSDVK